MEKVSIARRFTLGNRCPTHFASHNHLRVHSVSFDEFLAAFRKEEKRLGQKVVMMESSLNGDSTTLVGLDAVIPGGKYDKEVSASASN